MMKKMMAGMMLAAAVTAIGAGAVFADSVDKVDTKGIAFGIPEEIRDLVTVQTDGLDADTLVAVYETASMDAARNMGEENNGAGWIFSITTIPEEEVKELRCGDMSGLEVFAEDEDICYVYAHPTDVRILREEETEYEGGLDQWGKINEWAWQEVRQEILANNPELDEEFYTNTYLDMLLAQGAYKPGTKFELRALEYGPDALDPAAIDEDDYIEDLAEDFTYEVLPEAEAPDGEYYVLAFDADGEEVRYDFFKNSESLNLVREVRTVDGEEMETFYQANIKDADDADETAAGIMEKWCKAVATGEVDDD